MLLLKRQFLPLVRSGKKRQTIRVWTHQRIKAPCVSYTPGLGKIFVSRVERVAGLKALTRADALADGFCSRKELLAALADIYGAKVPDSMQIYRIQFAWPVPANISTSTPVRNPMRRAAVGGKSDSKPQRRGALKTLRAQLRRFVLAQAPARR